MKKRYQFASSSAFLRVALTLAFLLAPSGASAFGQALPAAEASPISTGFALPTNLGSLQWGVTASQSLLWGYYGNSGTASLTNLNADVAYLSSSKRFPFSMVLSGGRSWSESGQPSYYFLNTGFSQVVNVGRWNFVASDNVSYLPGTPAGGLSGIPGVGDLGVNPVQIGTDVGQGVLTNFSTRIENAVAGSAQRMLTGKTSITGTGSYDILRFLDGPGGSGLDSSWVSGGGGINHQVDGRTSYGGNYSYADFVYSKNSLGVSTPDFVSQTASAVYSHRFTRKLSVSLSAGPQWTTVKGSRGTEISAFANASASYAARSLGASLFFVRSTSNGYGSLAGAISDSASFSVNRRFAVVWNGSVSSTYTHASTLTAASIQPYSVNTFVESAQVSRAFAGNLSGYASYTFERQTNSGVANGAANVFTGTTQVLGFGITYSPNSIHLGHR